MPDAYTNVHGLDESVGNDYRPNQGDMLCRIATVYVFLGYRHVFLVSLGFQSL